VTGFSMHFRISACESPPQLLPPNSSTTLPLLWLFRVSSLDSFRLESRVFPDAFLFSWVFGSKITENSKSVPPLFPARPPLFFLFLMSLDS
jgi:hypothetical protein